MARKLVVEFIGTFFLVLTIGMTILAAKGDSAAAALAPLAIGSALMVMVYAGGHVSGGHYNPAVTLAVWVRGKCSSVEMPAYMIAQVLAAGAAAFTVLYLKNFPKLEPLPPLDVARALLAEFLFAFALCRVPLRLRAMLCGPERRHIEGNRR
jgi:aquaporin Z